MKVKVISRKYHMLRMYVLERDRRIRRLANLNMIPLEGYFLKKYLILSLTSRDVGECYTTKEHFDEFKSSLSRLQEHRFVPDVDYRDPDKSIHSIRRRLVKIQI